MGDRTSVYLWVMKDDAKKVSAKINDFYGGYGADDTNELNDQAQFFFYEVNYGELEIQEWAEKEGIPYSYRWDAGGDYGPGYQHLRFDEKGKPLFIEFDDKDLELDLPTVSKLLVEADSQQDIHEAYQILRSFLKPFTQNFTPLEWKTQERNKLIARTVNLIS